MIILNVVQGWALIYVTSGWLRDCFCCHEDQVWIRWKCGIEARERLAIYRHVSHTCLYMHILPVCLTASQCVKISLHTSYIKHMLVTLSEFVSVKQQWSQLEWPSKLICKWQKIHTKKEKKDKVCVKNVPNFQMLLISSFILTSQPDDSQQAFRRSC